MSISIKDALSYGGTMQEEKVLLNATLGFLVRGQEVLLAKKTKKIGQGCWNGYGGGFNKGETPEQSMLRELEEEAGGKALPESLEKVAGIDFHNITSDGVSFTCKVYVYLVHDWEGQVIPTAEMENPTWFRRNFLPLEEMMP